MSILKRALSSLAFLCLALSSYASTPNQLLYVQEGTSLATYNVNPKTAVAKKLASFYLSAMEAYPIQVFHSPTAPYIYVLGFESATDEYFWVYKTTTAGVPIDTVIQKLQVKPAFDPISDSS
jgi:hypothetical protein